MLAGALQIALGLLRAGAIAHYFPSAVVKGMLTAIGVLLILKQLPHAVGFDKENFASESFRAGDDKTFSLVALAARNVQWGAVIIGLACVALLVTWEKTRLAKISWLPGPLAAVVAGVAANALFQAVAPGLALGSKHLVSLPVGEGTLGLLGALRLPAWSAIARPEVWTLAATLAVVASLEALLNLEAADRLDPFHRKSPPDRELVAQGLASIASGLASPTSSAAFKRRRRGGTSPWRCAGSESALPEATGILPIPPPAPASGP